MFSENVSSFFEYIRKYTANIRETISQRKFVFDEYTKAKLVLNEKKNKKLVQEKSNWDLDPELAKQKGIQMEAAFGDADIARRLMFRDVS